MSEIHEGHRYVYIRTAKTACRSTATWLIEQHGFESTPHHHEYSSLLEGRETWTWFTTVRDPYHRARSLWEWAIHTSPHLFPGLREDVASLYFEGFLEWLAYRVTPRRALKLASGWRWPPEIGLNPFLAQADYLDQVLPIVRLYPFHQIPDCYLELPFVTEISGFPHLNQAPGQVSPGEKTQRMEDLVRLWAPLDHAIYEMALAEEGRPGELLR